jgi:hypothetical protein
MAIEIMDTLDTGEESMMEQMGARPETKTHLGYRYTVPDDASIAVYMDLVLITPAMAAEMLRCNTANFRPLKRAAVNTYTAFMKRGRWPFNPADAIVFTVADGFRVMGNGQHRCQSCVESGRPFSAWVAHCFNASDEMLSIIDRGVLKNYPDWMGHKSGVNTKAMSAALSHLIDYDLGALYKTWPRRYQLTFIERDEVLAKHPHLRTSVLFVRALPWNRHKEAGVLVLPPALLAWVHYECAHHDRALADEYIKGITEGVSPDSPIARLRNHLLYCKVHRVTMAKEIRMEWVIAGWNAFVREGKLRIRNPESKNPPPQPFGWRKPGEPWTGEVSE